MDLPFSGSKGLDVETVIEYRHGNSPSHSTIKMPGMMKYADITLKKGVFADDNDFCDWISTISANTCRALDSSDLSVRRNGYTKNDLDLNQCIPKTDYAN